MPRFSLGFRLLFILSVMLSLPLSGARAQDLDAAIAEHMQQSAVRMWAGAETDGSISQPAWISLVAAGVAEYGTEDQARDAVELLIESLLTDATEVETDIDFAIDAPDVQALRATIAADGEIGPGVLVGAFFTQSSSFVMVYGIVASLGDEAPADDLVAEMQTTVETLANETFANSAGDDAPRKVGERNGNEEWEGGLFDKLPLPAGNPFPPAVSLYREDIYEAYGEFAVVATEQADVARATEEAEIAAATEAALAEEATATAEYEASRGEIHEGLIAFVGPDDEIWVTAADGSNLQQVTSSDENSPSFVPGAKGSVSWSHDGTMLAFVAGSTEYWGDSVWILKDGMFTEMSNTRYCFDPSFSEDNTRIFYTCRPQANVSLPGYGLIASVAIDGTDSTVHVPFPPEATARGGSYEVVGFDVEASTGAMLIATEFTESYGADPVVSVDIYDADFQKLPPIPINDVTGVYPSVLGPYHPQFATFNGSSGVIGASCVLDCDSPVPSYVPVFYGMEGSTTVFPIPSPWTSVNHVKFDVAPDESLVWEFRSTISILTAQGDLYEVTQGEDPAWQPVAIDIVLPDPSGS